MLTLRSDFFRTVKNSMRVARISRRLPGKDHDWYHYQGDAGLVPFNTWIEIFTAYPRTLPVCFRALEPGHCYMAPWLYIVMKYVDAHRDIGSSKDRVTLFKHVLAAVDWKALEVAAAMPTSAKNDDPENSNVWLLIDAALKNGGMGCRCETAL